MNDFTSYLSRINNCEPTDPLLSKTELGLRLKQIPLACLNQSELLDVTQALDLPQLIHTETGLARDYRGIAELMGFNLVQIKTRFERANNPTRRLINEFTQKNPIASLNTLIELIETIERFDVLDDFLPILIKIVSNQISIQPRLNFRDQCHAIEHDKSQDNKKISASNETSHLVSDLNRLTVDDNACSNIFYDAFICFAPEDHQYAQELIYSLEERGARVATADDLLPGNFEHDALMRLIDVRCRKVIIILTPNFSKSEECKFQTKFASEVGIKTRATKIIPVLYESFDDSTIPIMIQVLSKIDMNRGQRQWQLERLIRSLELNIEKPQYSRYSGAHLAFDNQEQGAAIEDRDSSHPPHPAITFTSTGSNATSNHNHNEPIVDLLHSEDSNRLFKLDEPNTESNVMRKTPSPTFSGNSSGSFLNRLMNVKKRVFKHCLHSNTNSQMKLISTTSSDLSSEEVINNNES